MGALPSATLPVVAAAPAAAAAAPEVRAEEGAAVRPAAGEVETAAGPAPQYKAQSCATRHQRNTRASPGELNRGPHTFWKVPRQADAPGQTLSDPRLGDERPWPPTSPSTRHA